MGSIRTLLALCVVVFHSYSIFGERMTGGVVAVQSFYIISGFYMALILNEKYKAGKGSYKLFLTNRLLRIYPAYWVCLFLAVLLCIVGKIGWNQPFYLWYWTSTWSSLSWSAIFIFIFTNIFLLGSDWLCFTGVNKQTGLLEGNLSPMHYQPRSFEYLFIPQIWSVGVEISFYLLAPLLLRKKWYLQCIVLLASLSLRYYLYNVHYLYFDPWNYRFFPNELAFFMAGSLAYQVFNYLKEKEISQKINFAFWAVVLFSIIFYPHLDSLFSIQTWQGDYRSIHSHFHWYFYAFFWISLPFIFLLTRKNKIDRIIGELSYPIYISHHFIMFMWRKYFWAHTGSMEWFGITCVISTLIVAAILYAGVIVPIEKIRQKRVALNASVA